MYRSPLLNERRKGLPGGGSGGALYYGGSSAPRPTRAARFASAVLLAAITLGAMMAQKVLICDPAAAEAAQRETALVDSLKRLQGSLASRNAQSGASYTAYQGEKGAALSAPEKVRYDRRIQEKEIVAQRAKKDAASARAEADECAAQLLAISSAAGNGGTGADSAAAAAAAAALGAGRAESKKLRTQLQKAETRAVAAASRERALQEALDAARAEAASLRARLAAASELPGAAPAEGGWAGPLDPEGSTEEGVREGGKGKAGEGEAPGGRGKGDGAAAPHDAPAPAAGGEAQVHGRKAPGGARPLARQHARRWPPGGADAEEEAEGNATAAVGGQPGGGEGDVDAAGELTTEESSAYDGDAPPEASEDRFAV